MVMVLVSLVGLSQTNLVPNSTFEKIGKKIKDKGEIKVAEPWGSPTLAPADLYVEKTKNYSISIPEKYCFAIFLLIEFILFSFLSCSIPITAENSFM